jgi:DNA-binding GntR family transcriptional regulator
LSWVFPPIFAGISALERELADLDEEMGRCLDTQWQEPRVNHVAWMESDVNFHLAVARGLQSNPAQRRPDDAQPVRQWIGDTWHVTGIPTQALDEREAIFVAIARKNRAEARAAMETHLAHNG